VDDVIKYAETAGAQVICGEPMNRHTTFRIGGKAKYFVIPRDEECLRAILCFLTDNDIKTYIIGNGSDLVISDSGIDGAVISMAEFDDIEVRGETMICSAGAPLSKVCLAAEAAGLTGLEFAYGIPGTVGGAIYMNAGAYGGEMKDAVTCVKHVSADGYGQYDSSQLDFGYRHSAYTDTNFVITQAVLNLKRSDPQQIRARMDELLTRRKSRQPLEYPSAGSVFKRPEGHFAGELIQSCGLKGKTIGGAQVSEKHAGFIINIGGATSADVKKLVEIIKREVLEKTGVELECEIKFI
jgi:UDP-N-acetylmuramate dehydrogenase